MKPTITIEYCPKCHWLIRAAWYAQEFLMTFEENLEGVKLKPSEIAGRFTISINDDILHDRKRDDGFPEIKAIKQKIRDLAAPEKNLGHSDKPINP